MNFSVLVAEGQDFQNWQECFNMLAKLLAKGKKVKEGFWESVLDREQHFPTGLQITPDIGIAIPHPSDPTLVNESTVAVTILPHPVAVNSMANPEEEIMVSVVLMLALKGSEDHLTMLERMMGTFQDEQLLQELFFLKEAQDIQRFLAEKLGDN